MCLNFGTPNINFQFRTNGNFIIFNIYIWMDKEARLQKNSFWDCPELVQLLSGLITEYKIIRKKPYGTGKGSLNRGVVLLLRYLSVARFSCR